MNLNFRQSGKIFFLILLGIIAILTPACKSTSNIKQASQNKQESTISPRQESLINAALWAKGRTNFDTDSKRFNSDCSGLISAIYWKAGIDLQKANYSGGGVQRIYQYLDSWSLLYRPLKPSPGDLIFWDNTYDKNGNGVADDELTHIGMVVEVSKLGDITYVHYDYVHGVVFASMYPPVPSDESRNTRIRMSHLGPTPDGLMTSGELYRTAGRAWLINP